MVKLQKPKALASFSGFFIRSYCRKCHQQDPTTLVRGVNHSRETESKLDGSAYATRRRGCLPWAGPEARCDERRAARVKQ